MKKHLLKLSSFISMPLISLAAISCSNNQNIPPRDYKLIDENYGLAFNSTGEITQYILYPGNNYEDITIPEYLTNNTKNTLNEYRNYTQRITSIGNNVFNTGTYSNNISNNIPFNPYAQFLTSITLLNSIEIIGGYAFQGTPLTQIVLPDSVVDIGAGAFKYCKNLESVKLSKNTKYIGSSAFRGTAITRIEIPNSVNYIEFDAFRNTKLSDILTIPDSILEISSGAFLDTQITEVSIPNKNFYRASDAFPPGCKITIRP